MQKTVRHESPQTLYRQMAWLVTPHEMTEDVIARHGLTSASPEVTEMEHNRAHEVLRMVFPIINDVAVTSKLASDVVTDLRLVSHEVTESAAEEERTYLQAVISQSALSVIAMLVDIGALQIGDHRMVGVE